MPPVTETRRFECKVGNHSKFWEITTNISSRTYEVNYGRIGWKATSRSYGPLSTNVLRAEVNKKINGKLAKGYVESTSKAKAAGKEKQSKQELSGEDLIYELDF